jgi:outer membrane protein assembly factor BamB
MSIYACVPAAGLGGGPLRAGHGVAINLDKSKLLDKWTFSLSDNYVWSYKEGLAVWSSPAFAVVDEIPIIFIGSYNRNLYAINLYTGKEIWRFTAGEGINSTPYVFEKEKDEWRIIFGARDRTVYCLEAKTGKKIWSTSIQDWRYTIGEGYMSSPCLYKDKKETIVCFGVWNFDKSAYWNLRKGELVALKGSNGNILWRADLGEGAPSSPIVSESIRGPVVFTATSHGNLMALKMKTGDIIWKDIKGDGIYSSPVYIRDGSKEYLFFTSRFGAVYAKNAETGEDIWRERLGYWVDSSPSLVKIDNRWVIYIGSYSRHLYALDALTGKQIWRYRAQGDICSTPAYINYKDKLYVMFHSMDDHLYILDGRSGRLVFKYNTGAMPWSHTKWGGSIWSSPVFISDLDNENLLAVHGAYDGKVYFFNLTEEILKNKAPEIIPTESKSKKYLYLLFGLILVVGGIEIKKILKIKN